MAETSLIWLDQLIRSPGAPEWEKLSVVYEPLLRTWILKAGVPESECDDVVQEVLMIVMRKIPEFEYRFQGAFRGWLRTILSNQLKRYFRMHRKHVSLLSLDSLVDSYSADSARFDREHDEYLAARAMQLIRHEFEPRTWDAFRLQILEGHTPTLAGEQLGMTPNAAVKARIRVLKRLREVLLMSE